MAKATPTKRAKKKARPSGKAEITQALLAAADHLFGQKGPDAVSVRDIAAEAGLMPTLVHRYFGSKDELIRQVMQLHVATFREAAGSMTEARAVVRSMFSVMDQNPAYLRTIAYLVLAGHEPEGYLTKTGMVAKLVEALGSAHGKNAQLEAAILVSQMAGWLLLEPFLLFASDYQGTVETARAELLSRLIDTLPPAAT